MGGVLASTRPQRLAVEIQTATGAEDVPQRRFNEATAISCGDLLARLREISLNLALQRGHSD